MADSPELPDIPRPSQLWKQLDPEKKRLAADAFWRDDQAANEQAEAIGLIAQRIKFRLKSVIALPVEKKTHYVLAMPAVSEVMAARLLVAYHLAHQRPIMSAFLDALGIAHEDGIISQEEVKPPSAEALQKAAQAIAASYPAEDVSLYLCTLVWQDPETWGPLGDLPESKLAVRS
jgi:acetyl-CoA acetyltransferase